MVTFSVQSIDTSAERTKANYLVSMMAEDVIGHRNTIYGVSAKAEGITFGIDGTINAEGDDGTTSEVNRFVEYAQETLAEDILKIVSGQPYKHSYAE